MSKPWTLPGAEYRKEQLKMSQSSPAVEDFTTIKSNLERIRKEQEEATKNGVDITPKPENKGTDAYYPSYYASSGGTTLGLKDTINNTSCLGNTSNCQEYKCKKSGVCLKNKKELSFYEHMELMLDENDEIINKYFPDPRIQRLIDKYGLKIDNESLQKYYKGPICRILPGI